MSEPGSARRIAFAWSAALDGPEAGPASFTRAGPARTGAFFPPDIQAGLTSVLKVSSSSSPRFWLDYTFLGLAEDMLVVLTPWEAKSGAIEAVIEAAAVTKDPRKHQPKPSSIVWKRWV